VFSSSQEFLRQKDAGLQALEKEFPTLIKWNPNARSKSGWRRFDWLKGDFANNSMWMTALVLVGLIDDCLG
jgi:hypothetical protein